MFFPNVARKYCKSILAKVRLAFTRLWSPLRTLCTRPTPEPSFFVLFGNFRLGRLARSRIRPPSPSLVNVEDDFCVQNPEIHTGHGSNNGKATSFIQDGPLRVTTSMNILIHGVSLGLFHPEISGVVVRGPSCDKSTGWPFNPRSVHPIGGDDDVCRSWKWGVQGM